MFIQESEMISRTPETPSKSAIELRDINQPKSGDIRVIQGLSLF